MKHFSSIAALVLLTGCSLPAQVPDQSMPPPIGTATAPQFAPEQIEQLLAPIALYPDALIALILPASTDPSEVVLAARFLQSGGLPSQADTQPWDDSVRALAHYPQVVRWMDENLAWTKQLGDAFASQPSDVMNAVQRLRARAQAAGTLTSTPQQQVIYEDSLIAIVPTDPNVIYIPYYDPGIVYVRSNYSDYPGSYSYFTFSSGFATGWWLSYGLDWPRRCVWEVNHEQRERYWREHERDWHRHDRPPTGTRPGEVHVWTPRPDRAERPSYRSPRVVPPLVTSPAGRWHGDQRPEPRRDGDSHPGRPSRSPETASAAPRFVGPTAPATGPIEMNQTPVPDRVPPLTRPIQPREGAPRKWHQPPPMDEDHPAGRLPRTPAALPAAPMPAPAAQFTPPPMPGPIPGPNRGYPRPERPFERREPGEPRPNFIPPPASSIPAPITSPVRGFQTDRPIVAPINNSSVMPPGISSMPPRPSQQAMPAPAPRRAPPMHVAPPPPPPPAQQPPSGQPDPGPGDDRGKRPPFRR